MRFRAGAVPLILTLAAGAEVEPQCRVTSGEGQPDMTMIKAGGTKPLAEVPDGMVVASAQAKTVGGTE